MKETFSKLDPIVKIVLIIIFLIIIALVSNWIYKYFKQQKINSLIDNNTSGSGSNAVNIGTKAAEINDALHGSWYSEDEVKAVNAVLTTPKALIPNLSSTYLVISGYNLKQDLMKYLSNEQWLQIQSQFN